MTCTPPGKPCAVLLASLTVLGSAALLGCGQPGTPAPPPVIDPWHHHPGAGEVIEPGPLIATAPAAGAFTLTDAGVAPPLVVSAGDFPGGEVRGQLGD